MLLLARFVRMAVLVGITVATTQAQSVPRIDSLPSNGLQLRTGWRWHAGDNPAWAKPRVDDSRWDTIRPGRGILRLPQLLKAPMGWLRLSFDLDSSVAKTPLSLVINQHGASEIYLDGTPYQRLGTVGQTYRQQETYTPASWERYTLPPLSAGRHLIAVRLSQQRPPWYAPKGIYFGGSVFTVDVFAAEGITGRVGRETYARTLTNYVIVGLFLMLSAIHFLYYAYRRQRISLIFGLTTLFCATLFVLGDTMNAVTNSRVAEWIYFGQRISLALFMVLLLAAYYVYLKQRISWVFWLIAAGLLIPQLATPFLVVTNTFLNLTVVALLTDSIRISVVALRRGQPNARLVLNSLIVLVLILLIGNIDDSWLRSWLPAYTGYYTSVVDLLFFLTLPISFAVILARDYAQTNRDLQNQLGEVQRLSTEKQDILTRQNETLEQQVEARTAELKASQQQLIQKEKMASLGELTAGIAHEIQNPLNFVNNFSEVSAELVEELREEQQKPDRDPELEAELLGDLKQNLQKITHHGGRASAIVKGMVEHSRTGTGEKQPTNLNALADEYLKIAYHGLRAKDKDFNAELITDFGSGLGLIEVAPQEIGRVLLNLYNNAFYAVKEKQKLAPPDYQPTVTIRTAQVNGHTEIRVHDNGTGIPESVKAKIFQPFFTTKPTGEGTGLGLSLSYDIVTKGHGGSLTLESQEGEGTTFVVKLAS